MKNKLINTVKALVLICACGGFIYASYSLTQSYLGYQNADKAYEEINNMFLQASNEDGEGTDTEEQESQSDGNDSDNGSSNDSGENSSTQGGNASDLSYSDKDEWVWDYNAMREYNPESLGYIKLDNSRIQYPIVQHEDNQYYLEHGSNRVSNGNGAIFVDARIQGGLDAKSCIVYGHDMLNGSMFAELLNYGKTDWCDTHQVYDIYIGYRHYRYYVFASFRADAMDKEVYKFGFDGDGEYQTWINKVISKSNYDYPVDKPTTDDKTIMLSTCIDDNTLRFAVCLVRGEEVVD